MKYSQLFGKTRKTVPSDAVSANHKLLLRGGYIDQLAAGIFTWMPLGLLVLRNIEAIIREELNAIGGNEVFMPTLIPKSNLERTNRWDTVDILFKTESQTDKEYGLGFSHEEVVTPLAGQYIHSYKDLPIALYQIQTKFRDELRAKSGVLRGREFGMKDLYSFHASAEDFHAYYELVTKTYLKIFTRLGLRHVKITEASGGSFTKKHSHEFNILTPAGEIDLLYCDRCTFAQNTEIASEKVGRSCSVCGKGTLQEGKAIEVGNIFDLGPKFTDDFGLSFTDRDGVKKPIFMGCYGIGTTRLVGTIVEMSHDEKGIIWPAPISPFKCHLISLTGGEKEAENLHTKLSEMGMSVLWDDRDVSAGIKFADADLVGIPWRFIISEKTGVNVEVKKRTENKTTLGSVNEAIQLLA